MKYKFVVDENIFYCAIRGVDEYDKKDTSSARFLAYLLQNCHKICLDKKCNKRFEKTIQIKLGKISKTEPVLPEIDLLIQNIVHTSEKITRDFSNGGQFTDDERIPRKDLYLARCANQFSAKIVTLDRDFREAVNAHESLKQNGVEAVHPKDAIKFVTET
ncbi:MAG: hypothetical protein PHU34_02170 [Candidatus Methanoperedens sp.]|nr:hypothetical protein [Candidatus Methanoperedens sp.]